MPAIIFSFAGMARSYWRNITKAGSASPRPDWGGRHRTR